VQNFSRAKPAKKGGAGIPACSKADWMVGQTFLPAQRQTGKSASHFPAVKNPASSVYICG